MERGVGRGAGRRWLWHEDGKGSWEGLEVARGLRRGQGGVGCGTRGGKGLAGRSSGCGMGCTDG